MHGDRVLMTVSDLSQTDFPVDQTVVETAYGFGVIEAVNAQFGLVKIALFEREQRGRLSGVTVSLPWDKLRLLPDAVLGQVELERTSKTKRQLEEPVDERALRIGPI
jgi:hypothetical protein